MAVVGYAAQGTIPSATTGAQVRVAIVSSTNASPIVVQATAHGFNTGDSIELEGHVTNTAANGQWQITKVDANNFALNGSTGNGVGGATGYAIDYQLQPALQIPSPGDAASMVTLAPVLEANANPAPYLYRRLGKWRLYNQYPIIGGNTLSTPFVSNPWANTGSGITTTTFTLFPSAQFSLESLSDTTSLPSYSGANELFEFTATFSVVILVNAYSSGQSFFNVGAQIGAGTGAPNMLAGPFVSLSINTAQYMTFPVSLSGSFLSNFDASNLYFSIVYRCDLFGSGTTSVQLQLVGPLTGYINQYRRN